MFIDKKLEIFLVVAELGSFSQAARRLSMSQSAISFHVSTLEEELGVKLFRRQGRTIALTREGECLSREGKDLFHGARRLKDTLSELSSTIKQRIHLAGDAMMCAFTFPWTLLEFREQHPGTELLYQHLTREDLLEKLLDGELDLGLVGYPLRHRKLETQVCFSSPVVLVASPDYENDKISLEELTRLPLLWSVEDEGLELLLTHYLTELGVSPKDLTIFMEIENLSLLKTSVEANLGLAFLPELTVANELRTGVMKQVEVEAFSIEHTTYLLGRRETRREIVQYFWDYVREREEALQLQR